MYLAKEYGESVVGSMANFLMAYFSFENMSSVYETKEQSITAGNIDPLLSYKFI